ncbi:hypothetical protein SAMN04488515_0576 [Cognatiyoonia koreensis]|uniref:Uncharacterized protein n=1 Tax=Cognatiyoonia koreensis TaxID=364200 RepID=A0A1I0NFI8_9RHOB|nr:hypothetical protein [Cognatiyoonia koreensis]SEV99789.1 hypothetical protein SAMN04488515_0576 [Cognatiyoonia koreensis]
MSRIELTTLVRPIRQVGSPRYAELDGLQNLVYSADVVDDETPDFWAEMAQGSFANFDRKMVVIYERPNHGDESHRPLLRVTERARNTLDCTAIIPVSVSFFQYCAGLPGALKVRMAFEGTQDAWWPEAGAAPKTSIATRYHVIAAS